LDVVMMVAQHYDSPTRLIDWSLDPRVALHFAAEECSGVDTETTRDVDLSVARIWCFDWTGAFPALAAQWDRLGARARRKPNGHIDLSALVRDGVTGWIVIVRFDPPIGRLHDQYAVATVCGDPAACHLAALAALEPDCRDHRLVFEFPASWKPAIRRVCAATGISDASLGRLAKEVPRITIGTSTVTATTNVAIFRPAGPT